jgi:flagellin-like hook-associated protein FlgL
MSQIPSNIARVPNALASRIALGNINRGGLSLLETTGQLSSGKRLNKGSDNPIDASLVNVLRGRIDTADTRARNIDHADSTLSTLDQTLGDMHDLLLEAKGVASGQIGVGSDADTRRAAAEVITSIINEMQGLTEAQFADIYVFGGSRTASPPMQEFFGGLRYVGAGDGLRTDLGPGLDIPITIGADQALGALSARQQGTVDLNPNLTRDTPLDALRGAEGLGINLSSLNVAVDSGPLMNLDVDLTGARSVGDALDAIEAAIREADPGALNGVFPGGLTIAPAGDRILVDAMPGYTITFADEGGGTVGQDLGLVDFDFTTITRDNPGVDLDPRLTSQTRIADFAPSSGLTPGDVVFTNGGRSGTVTVDPGMTVDDFAREVERLGLGLRVEIGADGRSLDVVNEVSGWDMSVEDSGGGTFTAISLGIRTVQPMTPTSVLNHGRGVEIADGVLDPITGLPDPDRNIDFRVTLADGRSFDVDLRAQDMVNVGTMLARINAAAAGATPPVATPAEFDARVADGGNGITFRDGTVGAGQITVEQLNGRAAEDLGLLDATFTPGAPAVLAAEDRTQVRVSSVFSALMDLRSALEGNDERGITLAAEEMESHLDRLATTQAVVGGRAQRVEQAGLRQEDMRLLDQTVMSGLEDLDYVEASSRFSLLQLAQQAGYAATAQSLNLSLIAFLR